MKENKEDEKSWKKINIYVGKKNKETYEKLLQFMENENRAYTNAIFYILKQYFEKEGK